MAKKKVTEESAEEPQKKDTRFQKGRKKTGGRKIGTKNKYGNIRDRLKDIIMPYLEPDPNNLENPKVKCLATDLMAIADPKDRADIVSKFMPYLIPRYTSTTLSADSNRPVDEEEQLLELDKQYTKKELTITLKQVTIVDNDAPGTPPQQLQLTDFDPDEEDDFDIEALK